MCCCAAVVSLASPRSLGPTLWLLLLLLLLLLAI
jgi:hypothetical protein